jgi:hypothetical protein
MRANGRKAISTAILGPAVEMVRQMLDADFPGLWPLVEAGLSTCATLLLKDNSNPSALILVGPSSGSKTTVVELFADHDLTYVSDTFTPAAFVSQASNVSAHQLASIDLLPRIRHRVLITPELAPMFRGRDDELLDRFKIITRVLDGQGLQTDKGTHGRRGYRGDYLFAWIGATTPIEDRVFRIMEQLGSRLFFYEVPSEPVTVDQLVAASEGESYRDRLERCKKLVHWFLTCLFDAYRGVRGVVWETLPDDRVLREAIARWAKVLSAMRSEPAREPDPQRIGAGAEYLPARGEQPWRANAVLYNLARGHALIHGRTQLTVDDLPLIAKIVVSSMPTAAGKVFRALVEHGPELTVAQVQKVLGVRHPETARHVMTDLDRRGVVAFVEFGAGKTAVLRFREEWAWCGSAESRALLLEPKPVTSGAVCVDQEPISNGTVCTTDQPIKSQGMYSSLSLESSPACTPQEVTSGLAHTAEKVTGDHRTRFDGDLAEPSSAPSPAAAQESMLPCCICRRQVPHGIFAAHVAQHERDGS